MDPGTSRLPDHCGVQAAGIQVLVATAPLRAIGFFTRQGENPSFLFDMLLTAARMTLAVVLTFLGGLGVKAFSRQREYRADAFAAQLVGGAHMAAALRSVQHDDVKVPHGQAAYAALKFSGRAWFHEWLSTHPETEKRIAALDNGALREPLPPPAGQPVLAGAEVDVAG